MANVSEAPRISRTQCDRIIRICNPQKFFAPEPVISEIGFFKIPVSNPRLTKGDRGNDWIVSSNAHPNSAISPIHALGHQTDSQDQHLKSANLTQDVRNKSFPNHLAMGSICERPSTEAICLSFLLWLVLHQKPQSHLTPSPKSPT